MAWKPPDTTGLTPDERILLAKRITDVDYAGRSDAEANAARQWAHQTANQARQEGGSIARNVDYYSALTQRNQDIENRVRAEIENQLARQRQAIEQQLAAQQQAAQLAIEQNNQYLAQQLEKLRQAKVVSDDTAVQLQNRRGGFYSGGLDYQLGSIARSYADAQSGLQSEIAARNADIWNRNALLAEQAAQQISLLEQQAPDLIRQRIAEELDRQRQFALQEGALTGRYLPVGAQDLIGELLSLKRANESPTTSDAVRAVNRDRANAIRNQLAAMGIDTSLIGANVGAAQAAQNVSRLGIPTMDYRQLEQQQNQWQQQFDYAKQRDAVADRQWQQQFDYARQRDLIEDSQWLQRFMLEQQKWNDQMSRWQQEFEFDKSVQQRLQSSQEATNAAITKLSTLDSREQAKQWLTENMDELVESGVDIVTLLRQFDTLWPPVENDWLSSLPLTP